MNFLSLILLPISLLYGTISYLRNLFFDIGLFKQKKHDINVISVGNLSMGGTGKTPHVEFIINLLKENHVLATLSRGYGRKTKGFILVNETSTAITVGDEPMQYFNKYKDISIAVDEKRNHGVMKLREHNKNLDVIVLDDAFQHRWIKPNLSILLTDFHKLFQNDYMVPSGSLREFRSGYKRADIIIVTKTPVVISPITRRRIAEEMKIKNYQKLLFSKVEYDGLKRWSLSKNTDENKIASTTLLFTGIENPYPLTEYLKRSCQELIVLKFPDHHNFTEKDIQLIYDTFKGIFTSNKNIITTEKDIQRLNISPKKELLYDLPICYAPIHIAFHNGDNIIIKNAISDLFKK